MTQTTAPAPNAPARTVHRIEVAPAPGRADVRGEALRRDAAALGVQAAAVRSSKVYLVEAELSNADLDALVARLLVDPVLERATLGVSDADGAQVVEVHPLPGVMDPAAHTVREAARELLGVDDIAVSTGARYDLEGVNRADAERLATRLLANPVIQALHFQPFTPTALPKGGGYDLAVRTVEIRDLDEPALERLSREGHLFLDLAEMREIQDYYTSLGREPTDVELETLAQTWSEHCVHKTLKSTISYASPSIDTDRIDWSDRPGHERLADGTVVIHNLLKSTVAAATHELIREGVDWTLSVFVDNAGIVAFDDDHAVCIKVETHNHPSAIEPYGGAATGVGGCIRDVIGTGLAAKPIANTDVFCVAPHDTETVPSGCLHPKRVLTQVVAGVRDYGNRMGIPTVNGAVYFDERYIGNPLVYCGCVGVMPRDKVKGAAEPGDVIVALGGRTGRDGIHGATFSSAELTDTHADEFSHAVQIGNAIEEKRVLDAILRARDAGPDGAPLYRAITDCGAGGFSSAVGEMGEALGAEVHLERAPLKYDGLSYTEIWVSEAQERMVLAVPKEHLAELRAICAEEHVELAELGTFGTPDRELVLRYHGTEVGRLSMAFLHDGIPTPTRAAEWAPAPAPARTGADLDANEALLGLLAHPNIASKRWIVRQYDHEVQGATAVKPFVGVAQLGPSDASVVHPVPGSPRALAIGCGLAVGVGDPSLGGDPYEMALAGIDECVRNLVCVGADPERTAILDNFCWPSCKKPANLGSLVRAAEGCYDAAKAYRTPFVSGKDSLNNQFTTDDGRTIEIPPTLLITGMGIVEHVERCVTSDMKHAGDTLILVGAGQEELGGSHLQKLGAAIENAAIPTTCLHAGPRNARAVANLVSQGLVRAAHDCSDGGLLVAVAEMLIGAAGESGRGALGASLDLSAVQGLTRDQHTLSPAAALFSEAPSRYVLEVAPDRVEDTLRALVGVRHAVIGTVNESGRLAVDAAGIDRPVADLRDAWLGALDW
ncbi:MAG: phosphoribosylformylglycinamidine synthase subunit PurL [Phycisphaerales bacterium]